MIDPRPAPIATTLRPKGRHDRAHLDPGDDRAALTNDEPTIGRDPAPPRGPLATVRLAVLLSLLGGCVRTADIRDVGQLGPDEAIAVGRFRILLDGTDVTKKSNLILVHYGQCWQNLSAKCLVSRGYRDAPLCALASGPDEPRAGDERSGYLSIAGTSLSIQTDGIRTRGSAISTQPRIRYKFDVRLDRGETLHEDAHRNRNPGAQRSAQRWVRRLYNIDRAQLGGNRVATLQQHDVTRGRAIDGAPLSVNGRVARVGIAVLLAVSVGVGASEQPVDLEMFTRAGCPHCAEAEQFLATLTRERPELRVTVHDVVADHAALDRLRALTAARSQSAPGVPTFAVGGELVVGFSGPDTTGREIRRLLEHAPPSDTDGVEIPLLGRVTARELGLPMFTIVLGLIDGFNPCAMWVLLFVLSLLVNLRDRGKMLTIGGTFVAVSGVVYFAFMAAWLNVFFVLGHSRLVESLLGAIALGIGALNVKDFVAFGRGLSFSIPEAAKPGIYARVRRIVYAERLAPAVAGAVVLAVLVNLVELLCTAGLPALYTHVLAQRTLPTWQHYAYLGLYNAFYMLDDAIVLTVVVVTLERHKLGERGGRWLKLVSGVVMVMLGLLLMAGWSAQG